MLGPDAPHGASVPYGESPPPFAVLLPFGAALADYFSVAGALVPFSFYGSSPSMLLIGSNSRGASVYYYVEPPLSACLHEAQ